MTIFIIFSSQKTRGRVAGNLGRLHTTHIFDQKSVLFFFVLFVCCLFVFFFAIFSKIIILVKFDIENGFSDSFPFQKCIAFIYITVIV